MDKLGNSGNRNSGNWNSGNWNSGNQNSGRNNSGPGYMNSGDWNSGHKNSGHRNSGNWNSGSFNSGDCNSGRRNSGDYNSGDYNNGYCNSITPDECFIFNKKGSRKDWEAAIKPKWMRMASITEWIPLEFMTDEEKTSNPDYKTLNGYLKVYPSLSEAYKAAWDKATDKDRELTRKLPNFDEAVFEEVFGFNPWKYKLN